MFGHMQEGLAKVYDPARFATLLGIDKGVQQDPQVWPWSDFILLRLIRTFSTYCALAAEETINRVTRRVSQRPMKGQSR